MSFWEWFQNNESMLSGIAAALVIGGALATVGRSFFFRLFSNERRTEKNNFNRAKLAIPASNSVR